MIVACGYFPGDQELAKKLSGWIKDLGPNKGHTFLLARDVRCTGDEAIKYNLESVFDKVEVINVPERVDGWKLAPNIVIRTIAVHIERTTAQPWLFIEPDVVPLKEGWVDTLAKEYDEKKKPFLGDFVKVENVVPHMSGVAVYPGKVTDHAPDIKFAALSDIPWDCYACDQIVPRMAQTRHIAHRWLHPKFTNQSEVDNLLGQLGDAVLFHSDHSGTLIDFLRERRNPAVLPREGNKNDSSAIYKPAAGIVDIFIKSYPKDYPWLEWCFRSIEKCVSGIRKINMVLPQETSWPKNTLEGSIKVTGFERAEYGNDNYLSQQVFKMYADTFTDADYILHIDSDTIFTRPVTPGTYFRDGKPVIMMTPIDEAHRDQQHAWRRVMMKFLGRPSPYEFMRRFPFVYPRWAYGALREFCEKTHGMPLDKYIMSQPYREFSEFNVMGFYLWEYHRDKFSWVDTSKVPESEWPELTVDQRYSHDPIPVDKWEKILSSKFCTTCGADLSVFGSGYANGCIVCAGVFSPAQPVSLGEKQPRPRGENKKSLAVSHGSTKSEPDLSPASQASLPPKTSRQTTLDSDANKKNGIDESNQPVPSLSISLEVVKRAFTNPLAKGRIMKSLKAAPIVK